MTGTAGHRLRVLPAGRRARSAVLGPLVIVLGSMLAGNLLGLWAGYRGGLVDSVVMRWVDLMWSAPGLLVIIVVAGA